MKYINLQSQLKYQPKHHVEDLLMYQFQVQSVGEINNQSWNQLRIKIRRKLNVQLNDQLANHLKNRLFIQVLDQI